MTPLTLGVTLFTYDRFDYAAKTLESTLSKIILHNSLVVHAHIASDGDDPAYIESLLEIARKFAFVRHLTVSNSNRGGYGANYNKATQAVHPVCEYMLALEDDWDLLRPFDPYMLIQDMQRLHIGCARLGYIGYTQELRATFMRGDYSPYWLRFDPASPEPHVFAGHPRIESREWAREVGAWPEGLEPGATEFEVAKLISARTSVGWPLSLIKPEGDLYAHIGTERAAR